MSNKKQEMRRKQEDEVMRRLLTWIGIAIGYEVVYLLLKRFYVNFSTLAEVQVAQVLSQIFGVLQWVLPIATVAALAWWIVSKRNGKAAGLPMVLTGVGFLLSLTVVLAYRLFDTGVAVLGAVAPVLAVLALIYYLYQKEFFCSAVITGGGLLALWMYRRFYQVHPTAITAGFVLGWVLLAGAVYLAWKLSKNGGKWGDKQVFPAKAVYLPLYLTGAVNALALLAALVLGSAVAYYGIFLLASWLFCLAVYYTVQMM